MADALVVIDIQNEYFPGGALTLPNAELPPYTTDRTLPGRARARPRR